jgi:hypothetical protein
MGKVVKLPGEVASLNDPSKLKSPNQGMHFVPLN